MSPRIAACFACVIALGQSPLAQALEVLPAIDASWFGTLEAPSDPSDDLTRDTELVSALSNGLPQPRWDVGVGTAILTRGTLAGGPIMVERAPNRGTLLDARQFGFDWGAGPDISARRALGSGGFFDAVGFRYLDVQSMSADTLVPNLRGVVWAFPAGSGSEPPIFRHVEAGYSSRLYSFETDVYRGIDGSDVQWLTGFRWIQASDALGLVGTTPTQTAGWNWNTQNNLYGWQLGAVVPLLSPESRWSLSCSPKAGVYGNQCLGRYDNGIPAGSIQNSNSVFRDQVAFAGDLSASLGYRVSRNCAVEVGYQLLWLNGIGVAGDQPPVLSTDSIASGLDSSGSAFFQGALAGLRFSW